MADLSLFFFFASLQLVILIHTVTLLFTNSLQVLLLFSGIVYHAGDKMLYYPEVPPNSRMFVASPNSVNLSFESIYLKSLDNTKLHSYLLLQPQPQLCPTILFFHGNAGNIGHRLPNVRGLFKHLQANIFLLEYRGYGLSEGIPSESGIYKDAQAALNYLHTRQDIDRRRIVIFGRSLGILQISCETAEGFQFPVLFWRWSCCYRPGFPANGLGKYLLPVIGEQFYKYSWYG